MFLSDLERPNSLVSVVRLNGGTVSGEVTLDDLNSALVLHDTSDLSREFAEARYLTGRLMTGQRISFLRCHHTADWERVSPDGPLHSAHFFPHFVAVGTCHVGEGTALKKLHLRIHDAGSIFHDHDAFGTCPATPEQLAGVLARYPNPIIPGERPRIAFFNGREMIFTKETVIGRVTASNRVNYDLGGPGGASLTNRIMLSIEPESPCTFDEMIERVHALLRFFQIIAGRRQVVEEMWGEADLTPDEDPGLFQLYWSSHRRDPDGRGASWQDMPINGSLEPDAFGELLARWLDLDQERWVARVRFCAATGRGDGYSADRLVAAANAFDLLPKSTAPPKPKADPAFEQALKAAKASFEALPSTPVRDAALDALGRVNRANLKRKVLYRAEGVIRRSKASLPDFEFVLGEAVNARNFYVHGPSSKKDPSAYFHANLAFLTDALEFAFATSELIDSGWKFRTGVGGGTTGSHRFGDFIAGYRRRRKRLEDTRSLTVAAAP